MSKGLQSVPDNLKPFYYPKEMLDTLDQTTTRWFPKFDASLVFNYMDIGRVILETSRQDKEGLQKLFREQLGLYWDNSNMRFSNIYGEEFCVSVYGQIHVWNHTGSTSVGHYPVTKAGVKQMLTDAEEWTSGGMTCSGCGEKMKRSEVAGHFFAGAYCARCWNEDWIDKNGKRHENMKAVESREKYD
jgi:hypothetical protein